MVYLITYFLPIPVVLYIRPDYNFFNDLFYYQLANSSQRTKDVAYFIFQSEIEQGFFSPFRTIFELLQYVASFNNPSILLVINSWIVISLIFAYMSFVPKKEIFKGISNRTVFVLFTMAWPWTLDLFIYPGTVEKFLLLTLLINIYFINSKFASSTHNFIWIVIFFSLIVVGVLFRIQFITFIPALLYLLFTNGKLRSRRSFLITLSPILLGVGLLLHIFLNGEYTSKPYFSLSHYFDVFRQVFSYLPNLIFIFVLCILLVTHFVILIKHRKSPNFINLNFWFLLIIFYSLPLLVWGKLGYHLSILGFPLSLYILSGFQILFNGFTVEKKFFQPLYNFLFLLVILFSSFKLTYSLNPASSLRDFFQSKIAVDLNDSFATIFLNCTEGAERIPIFAERYLKPNQINFYQYNLKSYLEEDANNLFILGNSTFCPLPNELARNLQSVWSSSKFNSYTLYKLQIRND